MRVYIKDRHKERERERERELNDKWRDEQLEFVEWYYLFGP